MKAAAGMMLLIAVAPTAASAKAWKLDDCPKFSSLQLLAKELRDSSASVTDGFDSRSRRKHSKFQNLPPKALTMFGRQVVDVVLSSHEHSREYDAISFRLNIPEYLPIKSKFLQARTPPTPECGPVACTWRPDHSDDVWKRGELRWASVGAGFPLVTLACEYQEHDFKRDPLGNW